MESTRKRHALLGGDKALQSGATITSMQQTGHAVKRYDPYLWKNNVPIVPGLALLAAPDSTISLVSPPPPSSSSSSSSSNVYLAPSDNQSSCLCSSRASNSPFATCTQRPMPPPSDFSTAERGEYPFKPSDFSGHSRGTP